MFLQVAETALKARFCSLTLVLPCYQWESIWSMVQPYQISPLAEALPAPSVAKDGPDPNIAHVPVSWLSPCHLSFMEKFFQSSTYGHIHWQWLAQNFLQMWRNKDSMNPVDGSLKRPSRSAGKMLQNQYSPTSTRTSLGWCWVEPSWSDTSYTVASQKFLIQHHWW